MFLCVALCRTELQYFALCGIVLYSIGLIALYCTLLHCSVLYIIVLYCMKSSMMDLKTVINSNSCYHDATSEMS